MKFTVVSEIVPKDNLEISIGGGQPVGNTPHVKDTLLRSQVVAGGARDQSVVPERVTHKGHITGPGLAAKNWNELCACSLQSDSLPPPDNTSCWKGLHA